MSANMHAGTPAYAGAFNPQYQATLLLVGRILMALLFVWFGYLKASNWGGTETYFAKWGFSWAPWLGAALAVIFELGGGIALLAGWKTRWVAWLLVLFVAIATFMAHRFWAVDAAQYANQLNNFLKNIAVIGGLLMLVAHGPGSASVDKR